MAGNANFDKCRRPCCPLMYFNISFMVNKLSGEIDPLFGHSAQYELNIARLMLNSV